MKPNVPADYQSIITGYPWPHKTVHRRALALARVAWLLKEEGEFRSSNTTDAIRRALAARGCPVDSPVLSLLNDLEAEPYRMVEIERGSKRLLAVRLRPGVELPPNPWDIDRAMEGPGEPEPEPAPEPAPEPEVPEPAPAPERVEELLLENSMLRADLDGLRAERAAPAPGVDLDALARDQKAVLIMELAGRLLLDDALEAVTPAPAPAGDGALRVQLAQALDRAHRLEEHLGRAEARRQQAEETAARHRKALEAERRARLTIEANLKAVMDGLRSKRATFTEDEALDRLMRQRPA